MHDFQGLMRDATRLTQAGDLQGATAAIQAALAGKQPAQPDDDTIDVEARLVDEGAPTPPAAGGDTFTTGSFGAGMMQRNYKLYVPPGAPSNAPLVVMLHGCKQDPDDFAAGTAMNDAARAQGFYVLYPGQSQRANPQRCWNWFKHSHQQRGRGEAALLADMTSKVMAQHGIARGRVYVAGLSAGGAMAAILANTYPDLFAAAGVHSGLAAGAASDLPSALQAMRSGGKAAMAATQGVPTIVFHGDADGTVHPVNGEQVIAASAHGATVETTQGKAAGGRNYTRTVHRTPDGAVVAEHWRIHGAPHAWSGGSARGSYTDPRGPDATGEMVRFFKEHPRSSRT